MENTHTHTLKDSVSMLSHTIIGIPAPLWCMYMWRAPVLLILIGLHRRRFQPAVDPRFSVVPPFPQIIRVFTRLSALARAPWLSEWKGEKAKRTCCRFCEITSRSCQGAPHWRFSGSVGCRPPHSLLYHSHTPSFYVEGLCLKGCSPLQNKTCPSYGLCWIFALAVACSL